MKTPLLYSMVPIAPSKTTIEFGSRRRSMFTSSRPAHRVVFRLRVMHDDRRRALFRDQLEGTRQLHAELALRGKDSKQLRVVLQVRAGTVTPRVALALTGGHAE